MKTAVFGIYMNNSGLIAVTTLPVDKRQQPENLNIDFGLPGGKVDPGETPHEALIREMREEGWDVDPANVMFSEEPVYSMEFGGFNCLWFSVYATFELTPLTDYKEKHRRVFPMYTDYRLITGLGNEDALLTYINKRLNISYA